MTLTFSFHWPWALTSILTLLWVETIYLVHILALNLRSWLLDLELDNFQLTLSDDIASLWYLLLVHSVCKLLHLNRGNILSRWGLSSLWTLGFGCTATLLCVSIIYFMFKHVSRKVFLYLSRREILEEVIVFYGLFDQGPGVEIFLNLRFRLINKIHLSYLWPCRCLGWGRRRHSGQKHPA